MTLNLTPQQYQQLRQRYDFYHAELDRLQPTKSGAHCVDSALAAQLPEPLTNEEISAIEVYEFNQDPPTKYFGYVNEERRELTTWTGDTLGTIQFGRTYRNNMGDQRRPVTVNAINGATYHGTYYKSAGDYARIKKAKRP